MLSYILPCQSPGILLWGMGPACHPQGAGISLPSHNPSQACIRIKALCLLPAVVGSASPPTPCASQGLCTLVHAEEGKSQS